MFQLLTYWTRARKELSHSQLVSEVLSQLVGRFKPEVTLIKKRIEDLIVREYLERPDEDGAPSMYRYMAWLRLRHSIAQISIWTRGWFRRIMSKVAFLFFILSRNLAWRLEQKTDRAIHLVYYIGEQGMHLRHSMRSKVDGIPRKYASRWAAL